MTIASLLKRTTDHALDYLASLDNRSIAPTASLAELRAAFVKPLPEKGIPADQVIDALVNDVEKGLLGLCHRPLPEKTYLQVSNQ